MSTAQQARFFSKDLAVALGISATVSVFINTGFSKFFIGVEINPVNTLTELILWLVMSVTPGFFVAKHLHSTTNFGFRNWWTAGTLVFCMLLSVPIKIFPFVLERVIVTTPLPAIVLGGVILIFGNDMRKKIADSRVRAFSYGLIGGGVGFWDYSKTFKVELQSPEYWILVVLGFFFVLIWALVAYSCIFLRNMFRSDPLQDNENLSRSSWEKSKKQE